MYEKVLEMQTRSMGDNLIFSDLPEVERAETPEQKEQIVQQFLNEKLGLEENNIQFHVVHRLRRRRDNKPNSIVAKFERLKTVILSYKKSREKFDNTEYKVQEQYPPRVSRRNELWLVYRHHLEQEHTNVKLFDDQVK